MSEDSNPFLDLVEEKYTTILRQMNLIQYIIKYLNIHTKKENTMLIIDDYASQMKDNNYIFD